MEREQLAADDRPELTEDQQQGQRIGTAGEADDQRPFRPGWVDATHDTEDALLQSFALPLSYVGAVRKTIAITAGKGT